MRGLRAEVHDGAHLAALAFEAQDVAFGELHVLYIGIGCTRLLHGGCEPDGQAAVGPLVGSAEGDAAEGLRAGAYPACARTEALALYLYYIYTRGLRRDANRVASLLHIEHGALHEHTVGAVDAHADGTVLLGVEDECAVAHCRVGREDGLSDADALGNALHGSDGLGIGKAQDVGAAERDGRNVGAREVRHCHAFHRCGLATTGKREVDVGQFFLRHDREAQQGEHHGSLPAQLGKRRVLHTFLLN